MAHGGYLPQHHRNPPAVLAPQPISAWMRYDARREYFCQRVRSNSCCAVANHSCQMAVILSETMLNKHTYF